MQQKTNSNSGSRLEIVEYAEDELYYWLVFTVFFSGVAVVGAVLFVLSYKFMLYVRRRKLQRKGLAQYGFMANHYSNFERVPSLTAKRRELRQQAANFNHSGSLIMSSSDESDG